MVDKQIDIINVRSVSLIIPAIINIITKASNILISVFILYILEHKIQSIGGLSSWVIFLRLVGKSTIIDNTSESMEKFTTASYAIR